MRGRHSNTTARRKQLEDATDHRLCEVRDVASDGDDGDAGGHQQRDDDDDDDDEQQHRRPGKPRHGVYFFLMLACNSG